MIRRGVVFEPPGDLVTPTAGVRENDRLAAVALRGLRIEGPPDEFVLDVDLLGAIREGDVAFDRDGTLLELDELGAEFAGEFRRVADGRRQIDPLGVTRVRLTVVFQPRDEAVEPMAAFVGAEVVDLVDDDRPDVAHVFVRSERVIDPLVGADDDIGVGVESVAVVADARGADPDRHVEDVAVVVLEVLVLLIRQGDEGD